jgi:hypothetical protein
MDLMTIYHPTKYGLTPIRSATVFIPFTKSPMPQYSVRPPSPFTVSKSHLTLNKLKYPQTSHEPQLIFVDLP